MREALECECNVCLSRKVRCKSGGGGGEDRNTCGRAWFLSKDSILRAKFGSSPLENTEDPFVGVKPEFDILFPSSLTILATTKTGQQECPEGRVCPEEECFSTFISVKAT